MNYLRQFAAETWLLTAEMAPYLLLGFLFAGLLSLFLKEDFVRRFLGGKGLWATIKGSLIGVPMPLCSCGVIPVAASLKKQGASRGATVSFLTSTPQTGIDSVFATWALLGPVFTAVRVAAAFVTGVVSGFLVEVFGADASAKAAKGEGPTEANSCCGTKKPEPVIEKTSCCGAGEPEPAVKASTCCGGGESVEEPSQEKSCCSGGGKEDDDASTYSPGFGEKLTTALRYGFIDLPRSFAGSLVVGLLLAGLISAFVPATLFESELARGPFGLLLVTLFSVPLYVCSTGSIPFAYALITAGLSPALVLVFLITGPATNIATISTMRGVLGTRSTMLYLASLIGTAWIIGWLLGDWSLSAEIKAHHDHAAASVGWFGHLSAVALLLVMGYPLIANLLKRDRHCGAPVQAH